MRRGVEAGPVRAPRASARNASEISIRLTMRACSNAATTATPRTRFSESCSARRGRSRASPTTRGSTGRTTEGAPWPARVQWVEDPRWAWGCPGATMSRRRTPRCSPSRRRIARSRLRPARAPRPSSQPRHLAGLPRRTGTRIPRRGAPRRLERPPALLRPGARRPRDDSSSRRRDPALEPGELNEVSVRAASTCRRGHPGTAAPPPDSPR